MLIIEFVVSAVIIVIAGIFLTKSSENIAKITGLGQMIVGSILLSFATSLPELVTTVSSVRLEAVDLGLGNILGSNMFNLAILAILDLVQGPGPLLLKLTLSHLMSGLIILVMVSFLGISLTIYSFTAITPLQLRISPESIILVIIFFAGLKLIHEYEKKTDNGQFAPVQKMEDVIPFPEANSASLKLSRSGNFYQYLIFAISALATLLAGMRLTAAADEIAVITGFGHSFLGAALLAVVTSLPELTTTITAAKNKSYDLAAGNILGSNIFNLVLLAVADVFEPGSIIAAASTINFLPIFSLIIMIVLLMAGLFYRSEYSIFYLGISPALILLVYLVTLWLLFALRNIPII